MMHFRPSRGFTLIELSVVLVIIGLIVGGILTGQSLVAQAGVRATISQVEKYNTAVNTFRGKYGALPGDIGLAAASSLGFYSGADCTGAVGHRDGNGLIDGNGTPTCPAGTGCFLQGGGETGLFWQDLASVGLVEGSYSSTTCALQPAITPTTAATYMPAAKLGRGNFFYVFEGLGANFYGLSNIGTGAGGVLVSSTSITPQEAYTIDKKLDDGLPLTGNIAANAITVNPYPYYVGAPPTFVGSPNITAATPESASTCYDNGNVANGAAAYSTGPAANGGAGPNCALAFKFQ